MIVSKSLPDKVRLVETIEEIFEVVYVDKFGTENKIFNIPRKDVANAVYEAKNTMTDKPEEVKVYRHAKDQVEVTA